MNIFFGDCWTFTTYIFRVFSTIARSGLYLFLYKILLPSDFGIAAWRTSSDKIEVLVPTLSLQLLYKEGSWS